MSPVRTLLLTLPAWLAAAAPACAEYNRLLPFWAHPYPAGYVAEEPGYPVYRPRCRYTRRVRTHHGVRVIVENRCRPVLHARD